MAQAKNKQEPTASLAELAALVEEAKKEAADKAAAEATQKNETSEINTGSFDEFHQNDKAATDPDPVTTTDILPENIVEIPAVWPGSPEPELNKLLGETNIQMSDERQYTPEEEARLAAAINASAPAARGATTASIRIDEPAFIKVEDSGVSGAIVGGSSTTPLHFGNMAAPQTPPEVLKVVAASGQPVRAFPSHVTILGKAALRALDDYAINMDPRKTGHEEVINVNQVALFRALVNTINKLENDFQFVWSGILEAFLENKNNAFSEINVFRGAQTIPLNKDERATFFQLLNLIKITASPKGRREALRQVDPVASISTGTVLTHEGREKVLSFYNL